MTHLRAVAGAALVTASGCGLAWALAFPSASLSAALVRAVADGAAAVTVGLAVLPALDGARYRDELIRRSTAPLVVASTVWLIAELVRLVLAGAEAAGMPVTELGIRTAVEFALDTAPGRSGLLTAATAALVCAITAVAPRSGPAATLTSGLAAVGVVGHPLTGHLSDHPLGGVAIAAHALAAAVWCGALAAIVLTVAHRGQWARVLPRFSALSLWCVAILLVGGLVGGALRIAAPAELFGTGYGRVLSAKVVLTLALMALAWRNRSIWLPAATTHRSSAVVSRSRAYVELTVMATTLAAAATLAVTG